MKNERNGGKSVTEVGGNTPVLHLSLSNMLVQFIFSKHFRLFPTPPDPIRCQAYFLNSRNSSFFILLG